MQSEQMKEKISVRAWPAMTETVNIGGVNTATSILAERGGLFNV